MNSNRLAHLIILAAALGFAACGGATENSRGDGKAASTSPTGNAASPAPTAGGGANTISVSDNAAPAPAASSGETAAQTGASPAPAARGAGSAPQAKAPTPQIGSGGNDLFLFTQARAAINDDADLKAANVIIEVKEGVVTLSGNVASAALKSKAEQLARGAGAKDVKNQLRVSAGR
jgi:hypothetical protein